MEDANLSQWIPRLPPVLGLCLSKDNLGSLQTSQLCELLKLKPLQKKRFEKAYYEFLGAPGDASSGRDSSKTSSSSAAASGHDDERSASMEANRPDQLESVRNSFGKRKNEPGVKPPADICPSTTAAGDRLDKMTSGPQQGSSALPRPRDHYHSDSDSSRDPTGSTPLLPAAGAPPLLPAALPAAAFPLPNSSTGLTGAAGAPLQLPGGPFSFGEQSSDFHQSSFSNFPSSSSNALDSSSFFDGGAPTSSKPGGVPLLGGQFGAFRGLSVAGSASSQRSVGSGEGGNLPGGSAANGGNDKGGTPAGGDKDDDAPIHSFLLGNIKEFFEEFKLQKYTKRAEDYLRQQESWARITPKQLSQHLGLKPLEQRRLHGAAASGKSNLLKQPAFKLSVASIITEIKLDKYYVAAEKYFSDKFLKKTSSENYADKRRALDGGFRQLYKMGDDWSDFSATVKLKTLETKRLEALRVKLADKFALAADDGSSSPSSESSRSPPSAPASGTPGAAGVPLAGALGGPDLLGDKIQTLFESNPDYQVQDGSKFSKRGTPRAGEAPRSILAVSKDSSYHADAAQMIKSISSRSNPTKGGGGGPSSGTIASPPSGARLPAGAVVAPPPTGAGTSGSSSEVGARTNGSSQGTSIFSEERSSGTSRGSVGEAEFCQNNAPHAPFGTILGTTGGGGVPKASNAGVVSNAALFGGLEVAGGSSGSTAAAFPMADAPGKPSSGKGGVNPAAPLPAGRFETVTQAAFSTNQRQTLFNGLSQTGFRTTVSKDLPTGDHGSPSNENDTDENSPQSLLVSGRSTTHIDPKLADIIEQPKLSRAPPSRTNIRHFGDKEEFSRFSEPSSDADGPMSVSQMIAAALEEDDETGDPGADTNTYGTSGGTRTGRVLFDIKEDCPAGDPPDSPEGDSLGASVQDLLPEPGPRFAAGPAPRFAIGQSYDPFLQGAGEGPRTLSSPANAGVDDLGVAGSSEGTPVSSLQRRAERERFFGSAAYPPPLPDVGQLAGVGDAPPPFAGSAAFGGIPTGEDEEPAKDPLFTSAGDRAFQRSAMESLKTLVDRLSMAERLGEKIRNLPEAICELAAAIQMVRNSSAVEERETQQGGSSNPRVFGTRLNTTSGAGMSGAARTSTQLLPGAAATTGTPATLTTGATPATLVDNSPGAAEAPPTNYSNSRLTEPSLSSSSIGGQVFPPSLSSVDSSVRPPLRTSFNKSSGSRHSGVMSTRLYSSGTTSLVMGHGRVMGQVVAAADAALASQLKLREDMMDALARALAEVRRFELHERSSTLGGSSSGGGVEMGGSEQARESEDTSREESVSSNGQILEGRGLTIDTDLDPTVEIQVDFFGRFLKTLQCMSVVGVY